MRTNYVLVDYKNVQPMDLGLLQDGPFKVVLSVSRIRRQLIHLSAPMPRSASRTRPRRRAGSRIETASAKPIFDIYRPDRYMSLIAKTDKPADMKQILTHGAQLGQTLAARRRASRLSQRTLAARLGISQSRISEIEANPGTLTVDRLLDIASLLGLELVIQDRPSGQLASRAEW